MNAGRRRKEHDEGKEERKCKDHEPQKTPGAVESEEEEEGEENGQPAFHSFVSAAH